MKKHRTTMVAKSCHPSVPRHLPHKRKDTWVFYFGKIHRHLPSPIVDALLKNKFTTKRAIVNLLSREKFAVVKLPLFSAEQIDYKKIK